MHYRRSCLNRERLSLYVPWYMYGMGEKVFGSVEIVGKFKFRHSLQDTPNEWLQIGILHYFALMERLRSV